jgi:hypothetical protein
MNGDAAKWGVNNLRVQSRLQKATQRHPGDLLLC